MERTPDLTPYTSIETSNDQDFILTYFEALRPFDKFQVKRFLILIFDRDGKILTVRKNGEINLIAGRMGYDDTSYKGAVRREALEEANVTLGRLHIAAVIESRPQGFPTVDPRIILAIAAYVKAILPDTDPQVEERRQFLTKEELSNQITSPKLGDITKLIEMADFILPAPSSSPRATKAL